MLALTILDIRPFMSAFLIGPLFDRFRLAEARITTFCTYSIDGRLERSFFGGPDEETAQSGTGEEDGTEAYVSWKTLKPHCFDMIRGRRTPLGFRFTFFLSRAQAEEMMEEAGLSFDPDRIGGFALNLRFSGGVLTVSAGVSYRTFTADRSADETWERYVRNFLKKAGFAASEPS